MDFADLIIPILVIGSLIIRFLGAPGSRNEEDSGPQQRQQQPRASESQSSESDPSWDDLMEALGKPAAPPEIPPVVVQKPEPVSEPAPQPATPPPVPTQRQQERPLLINRIDQQKKQLEEKKRQLEQVKKQTKVQLPSAIGATASTASHHSRRRPVGSLNLRQMLDNRKSLKQAIVLNEILQPPVSMR
ncbi:MAG: hypothetical protein AAF571_13630 [Verrucomicrobiota bacterium]